MASKSDLKERLSTLSDCVKDSVSGIKQLKGDALDTFKNIFNIESDVTIYFSEYNVVVMDTITHQAILPYIKSENLVLKVEMPEFDSYLWVYQYFNERVFNDYLK
jgi:hypothetical protein